MPAPNLKRREVRFLKLPLLVSFKIFFLIKEFSNGLESVSESRKFTGFKSPLRSLQQSLTLHLPDSLEKWLEQIVTTISLKQLLKVGTTMPPMAKKKNQALIQKVPLEWTNTLTLFRRILFQLGPSYPMFHQARYRLHVILKYFSQEILTGKFSQIHSSKARKSTIYVLRSLVFLNPPLFYRRDNLRQPRTARHARLRQLNQRKVRTWFQVPPRWKMRQCGFTLKRASWRTVRLFMFNQLLQRVSKENGTMRLKWKR